MEAVRLTTLQRPLMCFMNFAHFVRAFSLALKS